MIPVTIHTLIMVQAPSPAVIVLRPIEKTPQSNIARVVPIWIGSNEATHMGVALERVRFSRPMTHDLLLDTLTNLDACVDHVVINDVQGNTFFARLALRQHDRIINLDSRPSDALALAVRQKAPIYIEEHVLEQTSFPYILHRLDDNVESEAELAKFKQFVSELSPEDFKS